MSDHQQELIDRIRALLAQEPSTREISMFGGRAFMVRERFLLSALKDGSLLVRISPERDAELCGTSGASPAQMGEGREMGPGWIKVDADSIFDREALGLWFGAAIDYNTGQCQ